jgi:hypothetical protein
MAAEPASIEWIELMAAGAPPNRFLVALSTHELGEWISRRSKFCVSLDGFRTPGQRGPICLEVVAGVLAAVTPKWHSFGSIRALLVAPSEYRPACLDSLSLPAASNNTYDGVLALCASHTANYVGQADDGLTINEDNL